MSVVNFNPNEIKTSKKVMLFYDLLAKQKHYPRTWADSIEEFDRGAREQLQKKLEAESALGNLKCELCGKPCVPRQVRKNNKNHGKWFFTCIDGNGKSSGHSWEWLDRLSPVEHRPVSVVSPASHETPTYDSERSDEDCLNDTKFVLTGECFRH